MNCPRMFWPALCTLLLGGVVLISCSTVQRTVIVAPHVEGAEFVGNRACYECHTNYTRTFAATPHARLRLEGETHQAEAGCEACHGPGSKHIAAGGGRGKFIINPGRDMDACFRCHLQTHAEFSLPQHHPLGDGKLNCSSCHDPHGSDMRKPGRGLAMARQNESCATCHREQSRPFVFEH